MGNDQGWIDGQMHNGESRMWTNRTMMSGGRANSNWHW